MREISVAGKRLELVCGDITLEEVDAIVNAANERLVGGGGVDGAIHRAGGPSIMADCDRIRAERGGCPTGEAVITTAGKMRAGRVIHTVGPRWSGGGKGEAGLLRRCYVNSLALAAEHGCRSVSFPSISTGVYRYPIADAARVALSTILGELPRHGVELVRFVLYSPEDLEVYAAALDEIAG